MNASNNIGAMNNTEKKSDLVFIINPNSCNCRTGKMWEQIKDKVKDYFGNYSFELTKCPADATKITRKYLCENYKTVVAVGGDGTVNEVVNGFFRDNKIINHEACLAIMNCGTGGDLRKTLGFPNELNKTRQIIKKGKTIKMDIGYMEFKNVKGENDACYFANIADFGMGGEVVLIVNSTTKFFGGFISYLWALLRASISYRNKLLKIKIDNSIEKEVRVKNVVIANGRFFGGGMQVAKKADVTDGFFDVLIIGDFSFFESLKLINRLYTGELYDLDKVEYYRAKEVTAIPIESGKKGSNTTAPPI